MSPPNTTQSMVIPEEQDFQSVPISNFLKMYPHNGENFSQPEEYQKKSRSSTDRHSVLLSSEYYETPQYLVKT